MKKEVAEAIDQMTSHNEEAIETGFEIGKNHADCEEMQQILKEVRDLEKRILEHPSHCEKS